MKSKHAHKTKFRGLLNPKKEEKVSPYKGRVSNESKNGWEEQIDEKNFQKMEKEADRNVYLSQFRLATEEFLDTDKYIRYVRQMFEAQYPSLLLDKIFFIVWRNILLYYYAKGLSISGDEYNHVFTAIFDDAAQLYLRSSASFGLQPPYREKPAKRWVGEQLSLSKVLKYYTELIDREAGWLVPVDDTHRLLTAREYMYTRFIERNSICSEAVEEAAKLFKLSLIEKKDCTILAVVKLRKYQLSDMTKRSSLLASIGDRYMRELKHQYPVLHYIMRDIEATIGREALAQVIFTYQGMTIDLPPIREYLKEADFLGALEEDVRGY